VEIRQYFSVVRRWRWLIVGCTLLWAAGAFLISSLMTPVYSASATLRVHPSTISYVDYGTILATEMLAHTYSKMLDGRPVLEQAIAQLGLDETPTTLAKRVKVEPVNETQLIRLRVDDTNPIRAALIANSIAQTFIAQDRASQEERYGDSLASLQGQLDELLVLIGEAEARLDTLQTSGTTEAQAELAHLEGILARYRSTYTTLLQNYEQLRLSAGQSWNNIFLAETAQPPERPARPRRLVNTALATLVGVMLGLGIAFLGEYLDDTIKTPDDVSQALGLGTLGVIGRLVNGEESLIVAAEPLSPVAEAFRILSTNIRISNSSFKTLLVTSPGPNEGKSFVAANLAVAMAQAKLNVVAVDADLRHPRLDQLFGLDLSEQVSGEKSCWGLTGSLLEGHTNGWLHPTQVEGLRVLPSGELPTNPAEMVGSQQAKELLAELTQQVDTVLIDSPPVLPVADATELARAVDSVLLVLEAGRTRREAARHALESLRQVGANVAGVILSGVPTHTSSYYYYSYREYYGNGRGRRKCSPRRRKGHLAPVRRLFGRRRKAD
jgi:non-specific protein-tyrosine kinase